MGWGRKEDRVRQEKKQGKKKRAENKKDEGSTHPQRRKVEPEAGLGPRDTNKKKKEKAEAKIEACYDWVCSSPCQ